MSDPSEAELDASLAGAELIDEPDDERLFVFRGLRDQQLRQLREAPGGDLEGVFIAEGDVVIQRALDAGHLLRSVVVEHARTRPLEFDPGAAALYRMGPRVIQDIAAHRRYRGSMACFERPIRAAVDEVLSHARTVVVTEGVNNPTNMGVMIRTAAALGVDAVLVDPTSCDPLARRCNRVSMGAVFAVPHARLDPMPAGVEQLHESGLVTVAMTLAEGAVPLDTLDLGDDRVAMLVGREGPGLSPETQAAATHRATIPMHHGVDSLNVATAAAIGMWEIARR